MGPLAQTGPKLGVSHPPVSTGLLDDPFVSEISLLTLTPSEWHQICHRVDDKEY